MRITLRAVGRLRAGPESSLVEGYLDRANGLGRRLGFGHISVKEIDDRKARDRAAQTEALLATGGSGIHRIALDERGEMLGSRDFAKALARHRDDGTGEVAFLIGGADGHDQAAVGAAEGMLCFGPMVWPHMLVRVMLAEQIFRALSILDGSPYHRD